MNSKHLFAILFILLSTVCNNAIGQNSNDALNYMNAIDTEYKLISATQWDYMKAASHGRSARKIEKRRAELISATNSSINKIMKLDTFEGSTNLRDSIANALTISYHILKDDYSKVVDLEEIAEQSYDKMEELILTKHAINDKYKAAAEAAQKEFGKFADENGIKIVESTSKISKRLEQGGKVWVYYDNLYLIYAKCQYQERNVIEAMNNRDMNALEQNKNTLIAFAKEGLKELYKIKNINNDNTLKVATMDALRFYQQEAEKDLPFVIKFNLAKENLDQHQKAIESKKKSKVTQGDIDKYNKSISDYNAMIKQFNEMNDRLNKTRSKINDNWNRAAKKFVDKNVP